MKKSFVIIGCSAGALVLAIVAAAVISTRRSDGGSTQNTADALAPNAPAPPPQVANLQGGNADVQRLIAQLGDGDWNKRFEATEQLKKTGKPAVPQLELAANNPDAEIRTRAKAILREINGGNEPVVQNNAGAQNPMGGLQGMLGGQGGAGGADLGALMQNPQVQQMMQQMMAGQGGEAGGGNLQGLLGGAGGQGGANNLGALMQNPQVQQLMQNPQVMQMVMQMLAGQGGAGGGNNLQGLLGGGRARGNIARNMPAPPRAADLSTDLTATFGARLSEADGGMRVLDVKANSPAANAGVKTGDLITAINGRVVAKSDDLADALAPNGQGKGLKIEVTRKGASITLSSN